MSPPRCRLIIAALIALHAALLIWSAVTNSVTFDEYAHLPAGVSYWKSGSFDIYNLSPPLLRLWAAAPVMLAGVNAPPAAVFRQLPPKDQHWYYARAFVPLNQARYQHLFEIGRMMMIALSCAGAWIVYRWASAMYGCVGGVISCAAYVLCPNLSAHGSLVGTDSGTAVVMLLACWLWWRYVRSPSPRMLIWAALAIGAAHLCKFTALLLWPMLVAMTICPLWRAPAARWKRVAIGLAISVFVCVFVINLGYFFEGTGTSVREYQPKSAAMTRLLSHLPGALPIPFPRPMVVGFDWQKWELELRLPSFLFGEMYFGSRWYYYPVALALKTPIATLALLVLAIALRRWSREEIAIIAAALVFLGGAMTLSGIDLGVRYVLPVLPLAFVVIGRVSRFVENPHRSRRWAIGILFAVLALENLSVAPRYLTFFNLFAGGPRHGQFLLNDSNFDWGQGLLDLKKWMTRNNVPRVQLAYFGRVDPATYGIDYDLLTDPSTESFVAMSSYFFVGLPHRLPTRVPTRRVRFEYNRQLWDKRPVATLAGGTIYIFRRQDVEQAKREWQASGATTRGGEMPTSNTPGE